MNPTKNYFDQLSRIINEKLKVHKNNCSTVIDFLLSMQKAHTVNLSKMVNYSNKISTVKQDSIYKSYQRLVHNSHIEQSDIAACVIAMFDLNKSKIVLSMDRTNWQYGGKIINFLVLSVCVENTSIPLYWLELDTKGNSNTSERIKLLDMFIKDFTVNKISYLLADREFIGNEWLDYLCKNNIKFVIRIKSNMQLETKRCEINAGRLFKNAGNGDLLSHEVKIDGITLLAQAVRSNNNELVIVVSNDNKATDLSLLYAMRWNIECLFGQIKTRGFNFEDTHFTIQRRVGNLMKLIVLSFVICYLIGLISVLKVPIIIKKHGRPLLSYFRRGLDLMTQFLLSNFNCAIELIVLCFNDIPLKQKAEKLISVMY